MTETRETATVEQPDEGGEYRCSNCGTPGWDCLSSINSEANSTGPRCCGMCAFTSGHDTPGAFESAECARRDLP